MPSTIKWKKSFYTEYIFSDFCVNMNAKKTKTMLVYKYVTLTKVSLKIDGDIIKQTDNYTNGKWDDEILKRIEITIRCWKR